MDALQPMDFMVGITRDLEARDTDALKEIKDSLEAQVQMTSATACA